MRRAQSRLAGLAWNGDDHSVHMTASMCRIFRASEIWVLVSIWPYMPTRKARCSSTGACSVGESSQTALGQQRLPGQQVGTGGRGSPWQSRVYSGKFLRAVCTTSKSRLPRQYMKVGRKSAAMLQEMCSGGYCPTAQGPRSPARPQAPQSALASHGLAQLAGGDRALDWGFTHLGLFWMERSARLKARLRQDSSAELISRCKLVCSGGRGVSPGNQGDSA